jgi:hypothetical protein
MIGRLAEHRTGKAQVAEVSRRLPEKRFQLNARSGEFWFYEEKESHWSRFSPSTSVFLVNSHFTTIPFPLIILLSTT